MQIKYKYDLDKELLLNKDPDHNKGDIAIIDNKEYRIVNKIVKNQYDKDKNDFKVMSITYYLV